VHDFKLYLHIRGDLGDESFIFKNHILLQNWLFCLKYSTLNNLLFNIYLKTFRFGLTNTQSKQPIVDI
jgi:hypothetical protein